MSSLRNRKRTSQNSCRMSIAVCIGGAGVQDLAAPARKISVLSRLKAKHQQWDQAKITNGDRHPSRQRKGSVALILVLVLALLAGTFAASVTRRASQDRNNEQHRQSIAVLRSAIDSVVDADLALETPLRLPLDESSTRSVLVETISDPGSTPMIRATLFHNDQPGLFIQTSQTAEDQR